MDFLPDNYEAPQGGGAYMKFISGDNKFRILSKPIIGWLDWKDKVPHRFTYKNKPLKPLGEQAIKHFWAMIVFDYAENAIKILEITQSTIQKSISDLSKNEEWGNPCEYNLTVSKKGQDMKTEYGVTPSPKKALTEDIKVAAKAKPINLENLFTGGDPFQIVNGEQTQLYFESLPF